jgi:predicted nuclease of predicted toxin-antitoxin system
LRFLVDANLSPVVAHLLEGAGHDAVHVVTLGLLRADDTTILERAANDDRVIVSADADFGALLAHGGQTKPSFVLLRSADHLLPAQQAELVLANLDAIEGELIAGAIVTFARGRLRVRSLSVHETP